MAAAALLALIALASLSGLTMPLSQATGRRTLDSSSFGSGGMSRILTLLEQLHSHPNLPEPEVREFSPGDIDLAFGLDPIDPTRLAATLGVGQEWIDRGVPVVSLLIDPEDREELEGNLFERGRDWERPAFFTYIDQGQVRFTSRVGARIHGGGGRRTGRWGYRLYFRRSYGRERFPLDLFPTGGELGAKRIILRQDGGPGRHGLVFHFQNAIASDIARLVGLPYVHSQPAAIFVNGDFLGVRSVTERIDQQFVSSHFGFEDSLIARTKKTRRNMRSKLRQGSRETYREFLRWASIGDTPSLEEVRERVDLNNLIRWILLVQVVGIDDFLQGTAVLNQSDPEARMFWVPWDLGISLGIWRKGHITTSADVNRFKPYFLKPSRREDPRTALNGRLLNSSSEYRSEFSSTLDEIWNHLLTPDFQSILIEKYRARCLAFGLDDEYLKIIARFLRDRPAILRRQLQFYFDFGEVYEVAVRSPAGTSLLIDGHSRENSYDGTYFEGSVLRLEVQNHAVGDRLAWEVDGHRREGSKLELEMSAPHQIRLLISAQPASATTGP